jgi:hypothetical protein
MSNSMNFDCLARYIAWRDEKRIEYKELSKKLRMLKQEIRATMRAHGLAGEMQNSLITLKSDATAIMEERLVAKQIARDSWEQWRGDKRQAA